MPRLSKRRGCSTGFLRSFLIPREFKSPTPGKCDSYEARLVELFGAFKRREREGTKRVKESTERWLCRHAPFNALAYFVTIRMPLNRMNLSIQST